MINIEEVKIKEENENVPNKNEQLDFISNESDIIQSESSLKKITLGQESESEIKVESKCENEKTTNLDQANIPNNKKCNYSKRFNGHIHINKFDNNSNRFFIPNYYFGHDQSTMAAFNLASNISAHYLFPFSIQQTSAHQQQNFFNFYNPIDNFNHKSYISAKKAENLYWPYSAKNPNKNRKKREYFSNIACDEKNGEKTIEEQSKQTNEREKIFSFQNKENIEKEKIESKTDNQTNLESNKKNKTSMCLINELIKYNKIKHEYVLLDEIGPAHKKLFFVCLKLGVGTDKEENYNGNGTSIKNAQHSAAELALKQTKFKHPIKRNKYEIPLQIFQLNNHNNGQTKSEERTKKSNKSSALAPTVLLNSLAMKLGLVANYKHTLTNIANNQDYTSLDISSDNINFSSFNNQKYEPFKYKRNNKIKKNGNIENVCQQKQLYLVDLSFAEKEFKGEGPTLQMAKNNAASKAIHHFSNPENFLKAEELASKTQNKSAKAYRPPQYYKNIKENLEIKEDNYSNDVENNSNQINRNQQVLKSEINLVYNYGQKLKKLVEFEVIQESGPSHDKKYVTKCSFGNKKSVNAQNNDILENEQKFKIENTDNNQDNDSIYFEVTGEGNSKKSSKKDSAIQMLKILKEKFEPLLTITSTKSLIKQNNFEVNKNNNNNDNNNKVRRPRKNKSNIIMDKKTCPDYGKGSINPISRLIQIQQANKQPEPIFELVNGEHDMKKTNHKLAEFVMKCVVKRTSSNNSNEDTEILVTQGRGLNKKQAKQKAADLMLTKLGLQTKSPLKPSIKTITDKSNIESSLSRSNSLDEKSEKKVKFIDNVITIEHTAPVQKINNLNTNSIQTNDKALDSKNQFYKSKLKQAKQKLEIINHHQNIFYPKLDIESLKKIFKEAHELLESIKQNLDSIEIKSTEADVKINEEKEAKLNLEDQEDKKLNEQTFQILNGSKGNINYKKILDHLSEKMNFRTIYQSLKGRDGLVVSYVNLSILPETEKPLNGQGLTHIESSNAAAQSALEYLSTKHKSDSK